MTAEVLKAVYQHQWPISNRKEALVCRKMTTAIDCKVMVAGFGAGSSDYIPGNAIANGHDEADSDLKIEGTNIAIEVTGPNNPFVAWSDDLWIRPQKVEHAARHPGKDCWVAHCLWTDQIYSDIEFRVVRLDAAFIAACAAGQIPLRTKLVNGILTDFYCVNPFSHWVQNDSHLFAKVREKLT
jgi:hypothetical protein